MSDVTLRITASLLKSFTTSRIRTLRSIQRNCAVVLLEQIAQALNDLGRTRVVIDDVGQDVSDRRDRAAWPPGTGCCAVRLRIPVSGWLSS